jgi:hypothetical protein
MGVQASGELHWERYNFAYHHKTTYSEPPDIGLGIYSVEKGR